MRLVLPVAMLLAASLSNAATFKFDGSFPQDDFVQFFHVHLTKPGTLSAATTSFAGGGFAPVLSLFESSGFELLLAIEHPGAIGACGTRELDITSGLCWDAQLAAALPAGNYLLALSQDDNLPLGPFLSQGFSRSGQGNFTGPNFTGTPGSFTLITGGRRTGDWALEINADSASQVPEPSSLFLCMAAAGLLAWRRVFGRISKRGGAVRGGLGR